MSSISLPLKMLIAGGALAGLTLLACGGDDGGGSKDNTDDESGSKGDAGKKDGGSTKSDAGKKDAGPAIPHAVEGEDCTGIGGMCDDDQCDQSPCFAKCVGGKYDACDTLTNLIPDSGLGGGLKIDGGSVSVNKDGGVTLHVGDADVAIPGVACPDSLECTNGSGSPIGPIIGMFTMGAKYCSAAGGIGFPPSCTATADCTAMGLSAASCFPAGPLGSYCIQICQ